MGRQHRERTRQQNRQQNRQRRRAKERRRQHRLEAFGGAAAAGLPSGAQLAALLLDTVAFAAGGAGGSRAEQDEAVGQLVAGLGVPGGPALVATALRDLLAGLSTGVRSRGWQPSEVGRVIRRQAGASAVGLVVADPSEPTDRPGRLDPDSPMWPADVAAAVAAIGVLERLRPLPDLRSFGDPAGTGRAAAATAAAEASGVDSRLLGRVRALLAQAESSTFAEEAETFLAKAQQLMTRYNLDRALVEETAGERPRVAARRCWLDDPYVTAKAVLLGVVAEANRCRAVQDAAYGFVTLVGHPDDLAASELLFTALLAQATRQLADLGRAGSPGSYGGGARARRPAFRRSFLMGFAARIGARLRAAAVASTAAADEETGGRLLPVLARRADHTEEATRRLFPHLVESSSTATDLAGWAAGTVAADLAELVVQPELPDLAAG